MCDPGETHENYNTSSRCRASTGTLSWKRISNTSAARKSSTSNFNDGKRGPTLARSPGGVGVSALGSKVRDYNIPGMPFRVHQFGTPVPSLRSSLFTTPRARARVFSPSRPSRLPSRRAVRSVPDEAPWKCIMLVTLPPRLYSCSRERACGLILSRKDPLSGNR